MLTLKGHIKRLCADDGRLVVGVSSCSACAGLQRVAVVVITEGSNQKQVCVAPVAEATFMACGINLSCKTSSMIHSLMEWDILYSQCASQRRVLSHLPTLPLPDGELHMQELELDLVLYHIFTPVCGNCNVGVQIAL